VETDGRETNRAGSSGVDNVVPFPRDWIGPLDELVPIGPSAERDAEDAALGEELAADSFWSESSASLHQVIEAPAREERVAGAHAGSLVGPCDGRRTFARRPGLGVRRLGAGTLGAGRLRVGTLCAALAVLVAGAAVVLESQSPAPVAGHRVVLADGAQLRGEGGTTGSQSNESARLSRLLVASAIAQASRGSGGSHRPGAHRHALTKRGSAASSEAAPSHVNVSYNVSPPTSPAPSAGVTTDSSSAVGASDQATSSNRSSSSADSGPVGAGAPFGPGQMTGG
jgi:hypothetical protein